MGNKDVKYSEKVQEKLRRQDASSSSRSNEPESRGKGRPLSRGEAQEPNASFSDQGDSEAEAEDISSEDFIYKGREKKPKTVTLQMPTNILEKTALTGRGY